MRQSEKWLAENAKDTIIATDATDKELGNFFEGTRDQWRDNYFDNADDINIVEFCLKEGLDLVIKGEQRILNGKIVYPSGYIGESVVNIEEVDEYKDFTPINWAMEFISKYGQTGGEYHKVWVLDQVARILKGTPVILSMVKWNSGIVEWVIKLDEPSTEYNLWVREMKGKRIGNEENEEYEYYYETGIAP